MHFNTTNFFELRNTELPEKKLQTNDVATIVVLPSPNERSYTDIHLAIEMAQLALIEAQSTRL